MGRRILSPPPSRLQSERLSQRCWQRQRRRQQKQQGLVGCHTWSWIMILAALLVRPCHSLSLHSSSGGALSAAVWSGRKRTTTTWTIAKQGWIPSRRSYSWRILSRARSRVKSGFLSATTTSLTVCYLSNRGGGDGDPTLKESCTEMINGSNDSDKNGMNATKEQEKERTRRVFLSNPPHGFRIHPFSWSELQQICDAKTGDLSLLCRSVPEQYKYTVYRQELESKWQSLTDHILCSKFQLESRIDTATGLRHAHPSLRQLLQPPPSPQDPDDSHPADQHWTNKPRLAVLPNDFPYFVEDGIAHWVLWKLQPMDDDNKDPNGSGVDSSCSSSITEDDITHAKDVIRETSLAANDPLFYNCEFLHWINPPELKSIPEIDHVHILCRLALTNKSPSDGANS